MNAAAMVFAEFERALYGPGPGDTATGEGGDHDVRQRRLVELTTTSLGAGGLTDPPLSPPAPEYPAQL